MRRRDDAQQDATRLHQEAAASVFSPSAAAAGAASALVAAFRRSCALARGWVLLGLVTTLARLHQLGLGQELGDAIRWPGAELMKPRERRNCDKKNQPRAKAQERLKAATSAEGGAGGRGGRREDGGGCLL